ncbi:hypothetical protein [Priestia megaterium]|uniref:hypothetical protein n=1 Tax=Priestia megaterium TaxID=1404 RepID=UPI0027956077|nr:hypothetical protein [Priestia megaterium]
MGKEFDAMELAQTALREAVANKLRIMAIKDLLIKNEAFTDAQYQTYVEMLFEEKAESYLRTLVEEENEE